MLGSFWVTLNKLSKEFAAYQTQQPEFSVIERATTPASPYPETEKFIKEFIPHAESIITPTLSDEYLTELVDTIHSRLRNGKTEYGDFEFFGLANQITSRIFELAAHQTTSEELKKKDPDLFVTSPAQSHQIYEIGGTKKLAGTPWTETDGFVFQKHGNETLIVGACEYTGELNLGDKTQRQYASPHKQKQLHQHRTGKVIHDAFTRHSNTTKRRIGLFVSSLFPEDNLSPHIKFDKSEYFSVFAHPEDDKKPPKINGEIIDVPLLSNDSYYTALSILHEIEYPSITSHPTELPLPTYTPTVIDLSQYRKFTTASSAAAD